MLALALVLLLSGASMAGAKYAGYWRGGYPSDGNQSPGYLSWGGAVNQMTSAGVTDPGVLATPHGGYASTTTKCVVCHSAHRASSAAAAPGTVRNDWLSAPDTCGQCHATWGASPANLLVEWAEPNLTAGPHTHVGGCTACHGGGIHGTGSSTYWGMNAFMLGGGSDTLIAAELPLQFARLTENGNALVADGTSGDTVLDWLVNGTDFPTTIGGMPLTFDGPGAHGEWAGQRSMLTGWTCSRTGCHTNSVFANVVWGQNYSRSATGGAEALMTGHSTAPAAYATGTGAGSACGPCHSGAYVGGYAYSTAGSSPQSVGYGCDQCHDMLGKATNSTAFPHGNVNIAVYEWTGGTPGGAFSTATRTDRVVSAGNLWMYKMNQATIVLPANTGNRATMVDPDVTVMDNAVQDEVTPGRIADAVCLKCHIPIDETSVKIAVAATGKAANSVLRLGVSGGQHNRAFSVVADTVLLDAPGVNPYSGEGSGFPNGPGQSQNNEKNTFIYLWR
jgi:hypothetical protein